MPRKTDEWIGKDDNTPIPPRVKLRVKSRANDCCENCGIRVRYRGQVDHTIALVNGGQNRESNLRFLCANCHGDKTAKDVAEKSVARRKELKLQTDWKPKRRGWVWRKFDGTLVWGDRD